MFKKLIANFFSHTAPEVPPEKRPALIVEPNVSPVDIRPDPVDMCFCGSEKFFKSCCGSRESRRPPPYGVFVIEDYLPPDTLEELVSYADKQKSSRLLVIDPESSDADHIVKSEHEQRISERVKMGIQQETINKIVKKAFIDLTKKHLQRELDWVETPQLLRYETGGIYHAHADSENMDKNTYTWSKVMDRDLSILIYLNDDYKGGTLYFDKFNYRLKPKPGMVVLFPSDNRFMHAAEEVTKGTRYVIVGWAAVKGVTKISSTPPEAYLPVY